MLGERRDKTISIQPSLQQFASTWARLTNNLLIGLDWTNVFVAGGMVLGTLLFVTGIKSKVAKLWDSSDLDIYLYGLSPAEANAKIQHIFDVFQSNLPEGVEPLVVRNSKTITFFAQFPLRRIQIVLKLVKSPLTVLLNFDLDVCAMGWDGSEVWMLPRAARALESASNAHLGFASAKLILCSWLERIYNEPCSRTLLGRASSQSGTTVCIICCANFGELTQNHRILKYANKVGMPKVSDNVITHDLSGIWHPHSTILHRKFGGI